QINTLFGQDFKLKKKSENKREGKAQYYVLASNDTIKHGDYKIKAYSGKRILLEGTYNFNKKTGLWKEQYYGKFYKGPKATGFYKDDNKVGEWCYFGYKGDTVQIYNWSADSLIYFKPSDFDNKEYIVIDSSIEQKVKLDIPPTCVGGTEYFLYEFGRDIGDYSQYFKNLGNELYSLKTKIILTIDQNGKLTDIAFSTNENKKLENIIKAYIKTFRWFPGEKNSKPLTTKLEFSVNLSSQY
ncbi:hypothetical protein ACE01N_20585, partial [Saccharicrinis sp. FJH2]|uniref:hypothetical protein n=1 Tax=Saccharicrinis sp. FJH65 TaxID=3344659 RepID=UPI0035F332CC